MREIKLSCPRTSRDDDGGVDSSASVESTPEIERKHVHRVYDAIAPHFSATRHSKWPRVSAFLASLPRGSLVIDSGCGNGKYLGSDPGCVFVGCDISPPLVSICAGRGHEALVADAVSLPYRSNSGDAAISIAVLHHLSTAPRRRRAVEELVRSVRKGGLVLVTVWAAEQEDPSLLSKWTPLPQSPPPPGDRSSSPAKLETIHEDTPETHRHDYFVPWHLPYHRAEVAVAASHSALADGLAKKDDKKAALVYNRYYHVFTQGELERLVLGMENAVIVDRFFDKSNWCIILQKTC